MSTPDSALTSSRQPDSSWPRVLYRGRFAPSPTGPLHFGSLIAATGSYLAARHARGEWLVRIDDLDPPREVAGSADLILRALEAFGFEWDGPVLHQSSRTEAYAAAAARLQALQLAYECSCSRAEIAASAVHPMNHDELRYPGWCRDQPRHPERIKALRFQVPTGAISISDELQGEFINDVASDSGDFVIRRRDGWYAYQLAAAVDDAAQNITHVVRGIDLLPSTPRQILLQRALGLQSPVYAHLPLAVDKSGAKLGKSTGAAALDTAQPSAQLWRALEFLQQHPPMALQSAPLATLWQWAIAHWTLVPLQRLESRPSVV